RKEPYLNSLYMKYFYYHCDILDEWCKQNVTLGNFNSVDMGKLKKYKFPLPPLPVQHEIVRILDNFTLLTAELTAELTARKKQYEYYRDELLTFGDNVEYKKIKDIYTRINGTPITAGKMKEIKSFDGDIRIFAGGKTVINAFEEDIPNANITRVPAVLVQSRGVIDVIFYEEPFTFKNEMWAYTAENKTSVKYLYYVLKNSIQQFRDAASGMGSMPQISLKVTEEFVMPVPSLAEQERIVSILDRFDTLCNDLTIGLPAEIEARRKQYEYYRDKLLTFKEAKA
ncbi:MAG: restriction endonuclease subunit S, partial [Bacteroidales bacterium]|nr:restriction endonuclease subunit S [Bacteroidales bacterium]